MPVHVWAMLSRGREAESVETLQESMFENLKGLRFRERRREYDGERHWNGIGYDGDPEPCRWEEWWVRRMVWKKRDGVWRGEWKWEEYDREKEWALWDSGANPSLVATQVPWHDAPQEILLSMARYAEAVRICCRFISA